MSDMNTIKTNGQLGLNANRTVNTRTNPNVDNKLQDVQENVTRVDTVSLTNTATQLQSLQQKLADTPVVDSDRVSALRAAISDGTYSVEPTELANNMIDFERQLS